MFIIKEIFIKILELFGCEARLLLERMIVTGLRFRFDIERVTSVPATPTIFGTLANRPF